MASVQLAAGEHSSAFVIVPFESIEAAQRWASTLRGRSEQAPPIVVTPGAERRWKDDARGVTGTELAFEGGWRAKYAANGTVIMARCEETLAPRSRAAS